MSTENHSDFSLLWTVGFAGKRKIPPEREQAVRGALSRALDSLFMKAVAQGASLTTVSSIARGGDLLFAEAALGEGHRRRLPWKCVLPFVLQTFLDYDLDDRELNAGLSEEQVKALRRRAAECERSATTSLIVRPGIDAADSAQREDAYLDCGYRVVDEADVVIVLLTGQEMAAFDKTTDVDGTLGPGSVSAARYAIAARHPTILLNRDADDPWEARRIYNDPEKKTVREEFFYDELVTPLVEASLKRLPPEPSVSGDSGSTENMRAVAHLLKALGASADAHQSSTVFRLGLILRMHLLASAIAAVLATVLHDVEWIERLADGYAAHVLWAIAVLAAMKPAMAGIALLVEQRLHRQGNRESWTRMRLLAELCRGSIAMWPLPQQPLDAQDEEDFPRVKRLLRTLRLMREQEKRTAPPAPRSGSETQDDADMRVACDSYIADRLNDQVRYYGDKKQLAVAQARLWRRKFWGATVAVIVLGLALLLPRIHTAWMAADTAFNALDVFAPLTSGLATLFSPLDRVLKLVDGFDLLLEALVIIAPFYAAYSLATMSLLDCRRRERRYEEMIQFLGRTGETLRHTESNASRLRLIEQAERSLIEEQHEWFSVMRNLNV